MEKYRKKELAFLIKFFLIYGLLQTIIYFAPLNFITESIAAFEAYLLGLESKGSKIIFDTMTFVINNSCTGLVSASVLAAIVFSLKKPGVKKKLIIFVPCAVLLFIVNLFRVYLVIITGIKFGSSAAEIMHVLSWFLMSGVIIALWYIATKKVLGSKSFSELL